MWWKRWWQLELKDVQNCSQITAINKPTPNVLPAGCPSCRPTNSVIKAVKGVTDATVSNKLQQKFHRLTWAALHPSGNHEAGASRSDSPTLKPQLTLAANDCGNTTTNSPALCTTRDTLTPAWISFSGDTYAHTSRKHLQQQQQHRRLFVCLFAWCLPALSAQTGYIVPQE